MTDIEKQIYAATFAAAFHRDWDVLLERRGLEVTMEHTASGFDYAEVADQAVKSHRNAMASDDAEYLLARIEGDR